MLLSSPSATNAQSTVLRTDLAISMNSDSPAAATVSDLKIIDSVNVASSSDPAPMTLQSDEDPAASSPPITANVTNVTNPVPVLPKTSTASDSWVDMVKGSSRPLRKKGTAFTLPSGEACVKISNSVIERNRKSWDCFILGQFYSDPPSHGTVHNIVNGIWSKQFRDIAVSKVEGNAFLFRIPNAHTRNRVLNQRLWQIAGQTMFVAKWDPGVVPVKPELTSAPIWLELRNVPLQFFNEESLEHIASLVGEPRALHPATANKTNLDVAKVLTLIDPRKPLPEAVNVQFDSGEIRRVKVSSPWMPQVCSHCRDIGHSLRHCKSAPITCKGCSSTAHNLENCPRANENGSKSRRNQRRRRSKTPARAAEVPPETADATATVMIENKKSTGKAWVLKSKVAGPSGELQSTTSGSITVQNEGLTLGSTNSLQIGESSVGRREERVLNPSTVLVHKEASHSEESEVEADSSDVMTSDPDDQMFELVLSKRQRKDLRGKRLKTSSQ